MLKSLGTEFKVGLFTIVALTTLGYMFFVLSPGSFENTKYATYYTNLANAAGIVAKTHVKTAGVSIGKVRAVVLEGGATKVTLDVDQAVKIPIGSKVEIRSVGLLGDSHLEIVRPEDKGDYVQPGGLIPQATDTVDLNNLISLVGDIAKDVKKVTATLANVLGTKKGETSVQNIVDNIEAITADFRKTTETLRHVVGDRETDLNDVVTNVRDGVRDLRKFAANLNDVLDDENKQRINRILASFDETMVDVKGSAKNINLISSKVEKGEGTIGRLVNDDKTLTELEGAIKDIRKVLAPATKLEIDVDYHGEIRRDDSTQHYFNILFKTRPDRYYLLGVTDTTYKKVETKTTDTQETDDEGRPVDVKRERIREDKALRFNLQVAKRWYFVTARFGLFETTGGLATDIHLLDDRLKLTAEAFDWDTQDKTIRRNAHFKTYASVLFYNHIQALAGIDDITRTDPNTGKVDKRLNWFFGAGMTFTDDDLKAILGTAALAR
jgi:phospholipid/cholesterol/gamma-HCH transport system substrate-binding protein